MAAGSLRHIKSVHKAWKLAALLDVETTGLHRQFDEVVELAVILFAYDSETGTIKGIVDEYVGLRDPGRPIPAGATQVHGIRDKDVRGKRLNDRRVRHLLQKADFVVAHNCTFDQAFVERLYPDMKGKPWLCSMNGVPWRKMGFASKGLQNLLRDHRITTTRAHRGASDARSTLQLLHGRDADGVPYFKLMMERYADRLAGPKHDMAVAEEVAVDPKQAPWPLRGVAFVIKLPFIIVWWVISLPFRLLAWPFRRSRRGK